MKSKLLTYALTSLTTFTLQAEILTVDNRPGAVAMFPSFSAAYDAAQDGDILILAGSPIQYDNSTRFLDKRITAIGPGRPTQSSDPGSSDASNALEASIVINLGPGSAGTRFTGLSLNISIPQGVDGVIVEDCNEVNAGVDNDGAIFRRCVFSRLRVAGIAEISNSLIPESPFSNGTAIYRNCIFLGPSFPRNENSKIIDSIFAAPSNSSSSFLPAEVINSINLNRLPGQDDTFTSQRFNENTDLVFSQGNSLTRWQLNNDVNNPAKGSSRAEDLGIFGGNFPISITATQHLPRINTLSAPTEVTPTSGLRIQLEAVAGDAE